MNKKIIGVAAIILFLDQITKLFAESYLKLNKSFSIISHFFSLTLCHNEGVAWGLLANKPLLIAIGSIVAIVLIYHFIFCFKRNLRNDIAFGLLIGGMSGNLIDRIFFGYVRDFFDFTIFNYDYPVFNISDIAIVIGVLLLIYAVMKGEDVSENNCSRKSKSK